ncbi:MAG TPA: hypothetical protein PK405_04100 [Hyphomicrobiales bacterium]|nr:hypothetical protein [Hyphomicrobiales bacterium]
MCDVLALYGGVWKRYIKAVNEQSKAIMSPANQIADRTDAPQFCAALLRLYGTDGGRRLPDIAGLLLTSP